MKKVPWLTKSVCAIAETSSTLFDINCHLTALTRSGENKQAFRLFADVHRSKTLKPDHYSISSALTAAAHLRDTIFGGQVHCYAIRSGLLGYSHVFNSLLSLQASSNDSVCLKKVFQEIKEPDVYSWTTLLRACFKLGDIEYACEMFDKMPSRDETAVWNAMITGCNENGLYQMGIEFFQEMHNLGVRHDNYSLASVLSVCSYGYLDLGEQVHSVVIKSGLLVRPSVVNSLITMYFNCQLVPGARLVFEEGDGSVRDQITFNVMIDGLAGFKGEEALLVFRQMLQVGLRPTNLTFVSLMGSCPPSAIGHQIHGLSIKTGYEGCTSVRNSAITMYSSFGDLGGARRLFESMLEKDLITWNAMISTYIHFELVDSAILVYKQMQRVGIEPDEYTFGSLVKSSENVEALETIQACVYKHGLGSIIELSNAMISAYSKLGVIGKANLIFRMSPKNIISWNTIISGFLYNELPLQGLEHFSNLLETEFLPSTYTLSTLLSICTSLSSLRLGNQVHAYIFRHGFFSEISIGNALITMYSQCGALHGSLRVFDKMTEKDVVSWNSLISAYARHGEGEKAVMTYKAMQDEGNADPDPATFTAVLSACSHAGLVKEGMGIFNVMVEDYGLTPQVDHFSCVVDLLARAGYLHDAENIATICQKNKIGAGPDVLWALYSACAAHGDLKMGKTVAKFLMEQEKNNPSLYVLLSNIYAAAGQWKEAEDARESMKTTGAMKQPGYSCMRL
ncbi:PREDICTED: pentatricopeptide repeat-containing protein At3g49740 [Tarenaya hassleriana]|uniref:pentatricopeptide repeat-containing protein At3g49740 n=1 Tax=Tarenaya hassleriana TaxID=28532 RepID=UPI00053C78FC|nr:PREDICTED: pentatricopeptide repeat-containing protein At3g49740 [Tarenaya hassleriana]